MADFFSTIAYLNQYYSSTKQGINSKFNLDGYTGKDIDDIIGSIQGDPQQELVVALEFIKSIERQEDVLNTTYTDYYDRYEQSTGSFLRRINKIAENYSGASKI